MFQCRTWIHYLNLIEILVELCPLEIIAYYLNMQYETCRYTEAHVLIPLPKTQHSSARIDGESAFCHADVLIALDSHFSYYKRRMAVLLLHPFIHPFCTLSSFLYLFYEYVALSYIRMYCAALVSDSAFCGHLKDVPRAWASHIIFGELILGI